jgi:hypothetical protein
MCKKILLVFILFMLFISINIFSIDEKFFLENIYFYLYANDLNPENIRFSIEFKSNGFFKGYACGESGGVMEGRYRFDSNDDTLVLNYYSYSIYDNLDNVNNPQNKGENQTKIFFLAKTTDSIFYDSYFVDEKGKFFITCDRFRSTGKLKKYNNIEVYTLGRQKVNVLENLNIRALPTINSKKINFSETCVSCGYTTSYIPKDTTIEVYARTTKKDKVQEWNNYWYLWCIYDDLQQKATYGWVYGEFLEVIENPIREQ